MLEPSSVELEHLYVLYSQEDCRQIDGNMPRFEGHVQLREWNKKAVDTSQQNSWKSFVYCDYVKTNSINSFLNPNPWKSASRISNISSFWEELVLVLIE
mgnify:CR=1 FL=1